MPRAIWTGSLSFGLVNVPVKLYSATEDRSVRFHQLERGTGERIRYRRVAERSGHEVDHGDIVKGYEVAPGEHVVVEPEELDAVGPGRSRTMEIEDFVDLAEVDPIHFRTTYYLAPADPDTGASPYELLRETLLDADRAGITRLVLRGKEHLAAVRARADALVVETMFFADEIRPARAIDELADADPGPVGDRERAAALQLVDALTAPWEPGRYEDTYRADVLELVERKAAGEQVVVEPEPERPANVVDLMSVLEASVDRARQGRGRGPGALAGDGDRGPGDLDARPKDELYEEAKRRDIPGRSRMSKAELVDALRSAS